MDQALAVQRLDVLAAEFGGFIRSIRLSNTELNTGEVLQFR